MNKKYYILEPEVAGGFGENTIVDTSVHPPIVSKLHYKFDGWLGDCLLETFPCFIFTSEVAEEIKDNNLTGITFSSLETSLSDTFIEIYGNKSLPTFLWGKLDKNQDDDFYINSDNELVVSLKALEILEKHQLSNCEKEEKIR